MTRYCAKAEPEVICDGLFLLYLLCLYIKVFSTFALEKLLCYAELEVVWGGFFYPYSLSKYIKVFSTPALEKTRYCATRNPTQGVS